MTGPLWVCDGSGRKVFRVVAFGGVVVDGGEAWCVGLRVPFLAMVLKQLGLRLRNAGPKRTKRRSLPPSLVWEGGRPPEEFKPL